MNLVLLDPVPRPPRQAEAPDACYAADRAVLRADSPIDAVTGVLPYNRRATAQE